MTASRFNSRLEAIDEGSQEFLQRLSQPIKQNDSP